VISRDVGGRRGALGGQMGDKLVGRLAVLTVFRARFRARKSRCQEFSSASISVVTAKFPLVVHCPDELVLCRITNTLVSGTERPR
jgi:hypothetical protein